jgi:integrase
MASEKRRKVADSPALKGQATLHRRGNMLRVRLPDCVGLGRDKYWSLGLAATAEGIAKGTKIVATINHDIVFEEFDPTLQKYNPLYRKEQYRKQLERTVGLKTPLKELWQQYCEDRKGKLKDSSYHFLTETIGYNLRNLKEQNIYNAKVVAEELSKETTIKQAYRVVSRMAPMYDWAIKRGVLAEGTNPYRELAKELKEVADNEPEKEPRPLTDTEVAFVLANLGSAYRNICRFNLLVGCRPSEATGITWEDVKEDHLILGRSYVRKGKYVFQSDTSKTNKRRVFPLYEELSTFLDSLSKENELLFPNTEGGHIGYDNYCRAWRKLKLVGTTPYCCRDTFITNQVAKGVPTAVVAQWVGNSVHIIEKHYLRVGLTVKPI